MSECVDGWVSELSELMSEWVDAWVRELSE